MVHFGKEIRSVGSRSLRCKEWVTHPPKSARRVSFGVSLGGCDEETTVTMSLLDFTPSSGSPFARFLDTSMTCLPGFAKSNNRLISRNKNRRPNLNGLSLSRDCGFEWFRRGFILASCDRARDQEENHNNCG